MLSVRKRPATSFLRSFAQETAHPSLEIGTLVTVLFCGPRSSRIYACLQFAFRGLSLREPLWSLDQMDSTADSKTHRRPFSLALARSFRGKLWDVILRNRSVTTFERDQVICDAGNEKRTFFFLQKGFVKRRRDWWDYFRFARRSTA